MHETKKNICVLIDVSGKKPTKVGMLGESSFWSLQTVDITSKLGNFTSQFSKFSSKMLNGFIKSTL